MIQYFKKTGKEWCDELKISIKSKLSYGFGSSDFFYAEKISKTEFLNRIAQCEIVKPENISRREAAAMKANLLKK